MAWSKDGYTCYDCAFYYDGYCEQRYISAHPDKLACRDFELG